jgi:hypothetical protein
VPQARLGASPGSASKFNDERGDINRT